jgi:hypothetical protein
MLAKTKFEGTDESNFTGADLVEYKIWKKAEKKPWERKMVLRDIANSP